MQKTKVFFSKLLLFLMLSIVTVPAVSGVTATPFTITAEAAYNKATVKNVQKALNKLGYDCGTADGIAGKKTKAAIKKYQEDNDLKVTSTVDSKLLTSLNVKVVKDTSDSAPKKEATVYITDTGEKYHTSGCRYLRKSKHSISLSSAKSQGYTACSVCKP